MTPSASPESLPLPPGRSGLPLLGETLQMLANPYQFLADRRAKHGGVFRSLILGKKVVFVSGPEPTAAFMDPENVTRERAHPAHVRKLFGGINMNMFDGPRHFALKSMALEAFTPEALASYLPALQKIVDHALAGAALAGEVSAIDVGKRLAVEAICKNVMGMEPGPNTDALGADYFQVMEAMLAVPIPLPWTRYGRAKRARDRILARFRATIAEHRSSPRPDGLGRLLAARAADGQAFTDDEAMLELHHIIIAGYIIFGLFAELLLRLTRDPALRARVAAEIAEHATEGPIDHLQLARLRYATQVVFEAKRTAPILPLVFGKARRTYQSGGYKIPQGYSVYLGLSLCNSDPSVFASPEIFDPERFSEARAEHMKGRFGYVPQGAEPPTTHRCLGLEYSTVASLVFLVCLLRGYDWQLPEQDFSYHWNRMPAEPKGGLRIKLVPR